MKYVIIARLEERLAASEARLDASEARNRRLQRHLTIVTTRNERLHEQLTAANAATLVERHDKELANASEAAANERETAANEREAVARRDARDFALYAKELTGKLLTMHERLKTSHFRSIENPRGPSRRPVAVLLDASNSEYVRGKHGLSVEAFPRVFKIVEGQEGLHVMKELRKLGQENCEVLEAPVYFANGITLRHSVNRTNSQQNVAAGEDNASYIRFGVFAFRDGDAAPGNDEVIEFVQGVISDLQTTPTRTFAVTGLHGVICLGYISVVDTS
ncbi:hypothetical protein P3T76_014171 [Phytophthora citrophthora]|uniref:Uncharacterized protein n=1 Tax=Phytophthora citrophthora TaxID=4793 RepID=A0AAD9LBL8_9STRA|nr:hypothetical protein P3T76_014171 [Phytophthora citrophthora]